MDVFNGRMWRDCLCGWVFYSGVVKWAEKAGKSILGGIGGFVVSGFVALVGKC